MYTRSTRPTPMLFAIVLATGLLISASPSSSTAGEQIVLPSPKMTGGLPLQEALSNRRSQRAFADRTLEPQMLSNLLWAAFGINRPDKKQGRTAPSARASNEIDIYVAKADGLWLYNPEANQLTRVLKADLREMTGRQTWPDKAPAVLIYVADFNRMFEASSEERRIYTHANTGFIAQNVYLFAASEGLATVVLGNVDVKALAAEMKLGEHQMITFTQPFGYPE